MVKRMMKEAKNRKAVVKTGLPVQMVASHANTPTALGNAMMMEAAEKKDRDMPGRPVANMWCTHTPKPSTMVATVASATTLYPTSGRRQKTGKPSDTMPTPGRTMAYTQGWPNIQNRCCHKRADPPAVASKK